MLKTLMPPLVVWALAESQTQCLEVEGTSKCISYTVNSIGNDRGGIYCFFPSKAYLPLIHIQFTLVCTQHVLPEVVFKVNAKVSQYASKRAVFRPFIF